MKLLVVPLLTVLILFVIPITSPALTWFYWLDPCEREIRYSSRKQLTQAEMSALDLEKAKDYAFMTAKPWLQIQGIYTDRLGLVTLTELVAGHTGSGIVFDLARRWDEMYRQDVADALEWCSYQTYRAKTDDDRRSWKRKAKQIEDCQIRYSDVRAVSFDDIRRWSYFLRHAPMWRHYPANDLPVSTL